MTLAQSIILGVIQGITEFLPISSSGHLIFVPKIFGWTDQGLAFDVVVHLGTLVAVVVYFRKRIFSLLRALAVTPSGLRPPPPKRGREYGSSRLGLFILLSIIPAGIVGLLLGEWIEASLRSATVVGASLIFWGVFLAAADGFNKGLKKHNATENLDKLGWKQVLFISCAQVIALIPGTLRSGITMTAGLFSRLDRKSAAEFSFLMSVPVIALAGIYKLFQIFTSELTINNLTINNLTIGFFASALSGFFAIHFLMKVIERWSFMPFVVYRVFVGVVILLNVL